MPDLPTASGYAPMSAGDVLDLVRRGQAQTRAEIGRRTGLSRTAVTARVETLLDAGLLVRGQRAGTGGRPAETLRLAGDAGRIVALAVGRSRSQVGVFDLAGRLRAVDSLDHPHRTPPTPAALLPDLSRRARNLLAPGSPPAVAIGLSLPASADANRSRIRESLVLPDWDDLDPLQHLGDLRTLPLVIGNDADVLAYAELGTRPSLRDALVVKASTGIAIGIISDGRVVHGHRGAAGELGHVRAAAAAGRLCRCGSTGCLETVAAGWALVDEASAWATDGAVAPAHVRDLVAAARDGDARARELFARSSRHVGEALATAVTLLNPEVVVLAGDMARLFDVYAAGVREAIWPRLAPTAARDLRVEPSGVDEAAGTGGVIGAASMALDRLMAPASVDAWLIDGRPHVA